MQDETLSAGETLAKSPFSPANGAEPAGPQPFEFRGNTRDYFRIWIVNVALSIVTLGIYSAWATVRTRRYFYANTVVAGSCFEYTAKPLPILKGRLLAVAAFAAYILVGRFSPRAQLYVVFAIWLVVPWLLVRALAFRARYTAWRGLHFRFTPDLRGAYTWYLGAYVLLIPTIGLLYPYIKAKQQKWLVEHHSYGGANFSFDEDVGAYYSMFFASIGVAIAWMLPLGVVIGALGVVAQLAAGPSGAPAIPPTVVMAITFACYLPAYLGMLTFGRVRLLNLLYNQASLKGHGLCSTLRYWSMYGLYLSNTLAILCTMGLAIPWAKVRTARYRTAHLTLEPVGDLDAFVAESAAQDDVSAVGMEMDGLLGIDIGM